MHYGGKSEHKKTKIETARKIFKGEGANKNMTGKGPFKTPKVQSREGKTLEKGDFRASPAGIPEEWKTPRAEKTRISLEEGNFIYMIFVAPQNGRLRANHKVL